MKKMILIAMLCGFVAGNAYAYDDRWEEEHSGFRVDMRYKNDRYRRDRGRRSEEFSYPSIRGLPLDWCLSQGWVCGQEPAQRWCERQGFREVIDFQATKRVGRTRYIDSGSTCQYNCTTYSYIRCR